MRPLFERGAFSVHWLDGALVIRRGSTAIIVDVPPGTDLAEHAGNVHTVVLTSGRMQAIGGLLPLLASLEPHRLEDIPLRIHSPLGEERAAALAEAWSHGWPNRYPLTLDAEFPGGQFEAGGVGFQTLPIRSGEPRWRDGIVDVSLAVALQITAPEAKVAWIPGAAPAAGLARICDGVDLAVVEVGVARWPRTPEQWRLSVADALKIGARARELWLVGDDGTFGLGEEQ